jgi:hypothetical protein
MSLRPNGKINKYNLKLKNELYLFGKNSNEIKNTNKIFKSYIKFKCKMQIEKLQNIIFFI